MKRSEEKSIFMLMWALSWRVKVKIKEAWRDGEAIREPGVVA